MRGAAKKKDERPSLVIAHDPGRDGLTACGLDPFAFLSSAHVLDPTAPELDRCLTCRWTRENRGTT